MGASYYDGHENTALHTDLCSPVATDPTWSGLTSFQKEPLETAGVLLWHDLVNLLDPHIILISVARALLGKIEFATLGAWGTLYTIQRTNPYRIESVSMAVVPGTSTLLVFGPAAQQPFGKVGSMDKLSIGTVIREAYRG